MREAIKMVLDEFVLSEQDKSTIVDRIMKTVDRHEHLKQYDDMFNFFTGLIVKRNVEFINYCLEVELKRYSNRGVIRTILIALKPIIHEEFFKDIVPNYEKLADKLREGSQSGRI